MQYLLTEKEYNRLKAGISGEQLKKLKEAHEKLINKVLRVEGTKCIHHPTTRRSYCDDCPVIQKEKAKTSPDIDWNLYGLLCSRQKKFSK